MKKVSQKQFNRLKMEHANNRRNLGRVEYKNIELRSKNARLKRENGMWHSDFIFQLKRRSLWYIIKNKYFNHGK